MALADVAGKGLSAAMLASFALGALRDVWTDRQEPWEVLDRLDREGCSRYVVTDVTKDGTLAGPNLELLTRVAERTQAPVIASGGVSSLDDLRAIATLTARGVEGAIVGKALYAGRFTLPQALAAVKS